MTNPHTETKPVQHPPEQEEAKRIAEEGIEWVRDWQDGQFEPAYYDKKWPVEMFGLADSHDKLARAYLDLLAAYEDRSKAFERAAADCVRLEGEKERIATALREMYGSYEALARMAAVGVTRPFEQAMNWDGPICARRIFGQDDYYSVATPVVEQDSNA